MQATIDGKIVEIKENETILEAARRIGIKIPTLCAFKEINHYPGACRVCVVKIKRKGSDKYHIVTSCNTPIEDGMEVITRSADVWEAQQLAVKLILADHKEECTTCIRNGNCELQDVVSYLGIKSNDYEPYRFYEQRDVDTSSPAIIKDMQRCIRCFRCVTVCRFYQGTDVLTMDDRGLKIHVGVKDGDNILSSACIMCGQCTQVCPVGALTERDDTSVAIEYIFDPEITTVVQFAPAIRVSIAEMFGEKPGKITTGQIISALKKIGADIVVDTNFGADLTIMEETTELLKRIEEGGHLPLFTSCCPAWVNYVEKNHPELIKHLSTCKSPQQMTGSIVKTYLAENMQIDPYKIRVISIMPCTAKKYESSLEKHTINGVREVDVVLTTREFVRILKNFDINPVKLKEEEYDNPVMNTYSGAGVIFGATGGVAEAAMRTAYYFINGKNLKDVELKELRGMEGVKEGTIDLGKGGKIKIAVVHSLKNAKKLLEEVKEGKSPYTMIEVMACPGGCIGGGGQPIHREDIWEIRKKRAEGIYKDDKKQKIRCSHENPAIQELYKKYLGSPGSPYAHKLLHTHYINRKKEKTVKISQLWKEERMYK